MLPAQLRQPQADNSLSARDPTDDPGSRATGQTLYSGLTYGLGIFVGTLTAGRLVETIGFHGLFLTSALVALLSMAVMWTVPPVRRNDSNRQARGGP